MTFSRNATHWATSALAVALLVTGTAAAAKTTDFLDLQAGFGYASNPGLNIDSRSSVFGRVSAFGSHTWGSERGATTVTAYVEDTTYFKRYGSRPLFDLEGRTSQQLSQNVTLFGDLGFQGDFAGQLSNRILFVPSQPVVAEPGNPLPPSPTNPDLFGISGRQYRVHGSVGASIRTSARGILSLTAGAQRQWFTGNSDADFNTYFASAGYSQQVSARTSAGATVFLQRQDFRHGDYANVVNPVVTIHTALREDLTADAAVGVMSIYQRSDGNHDSTLTPSFSGSICSLGQRSAFCGHISRDAQTALGSRIANGSGATAVSTSASLDYYRRLSENETLQTSLSGVRYTTPSSFNNLRVRTSYLSGVVGYDRKIGNRIYAGAQVGARKLFQVGPDPDVDFNGNLYLRYRLGDLL